MGPKRNDMVIDSDNRNVTVIDSDKRNVMVIDSDKRNVMVIDSDKRNDAVIVDWQARSVGRWMRVLRTVSGVGDEVLYDDYRARIFKLLRSPRIDFKESMPLAYVAWRAGTTTLFLLGSKFS